MKNGLGNTSMVLVSVKLDNLALLDSEADVPVLLFSEVLAKQDVLI